MTLIKCSECNKEVSSNADKCPNCGNPIRTQPAEIKKTPIAQKKVGGCFSIIVIIAVIYIITQFPCKDESEKKVDVRKQQQQTSIQLVRLENYINENKKSGFIKKFEVDMNEVYVWKSVWDNGNIDIKKHFAKNLADYCDLKGSTGRITIYDHLSGKKLATYSRVWGFKIK